MEVMEVVRQGGGVRKDRNIYGVSFVVSVHLTLHYHIHELFWYSSDPPANPTIIFILTV